ncbi:uracil-DNA glycosylase family protein [Spongiibacter sp. KMU-158]|uniref:Uracil-DNA glycosylase family protein n=1 Tax=Spongiibacter pelagi TaxID=2760804 RepID=A0A927GW96_9GAMM|nr:uracil-DNA glycosylase family protein [Spongiibacter pelagi]MBD2859501.1 uracil-DNA glycosylase family protein [Spongiibacter pelagi]
MTQIPLSDLLQQVAACTICEPALALGARPVVVANAQARLLIIGQAPGTRVHETGIPWNDPSGDRLREWLQIDREQFYSDPRIAIMPMGFCYPGKGRSGDLPPRPECAPQWHAQLLDRMPGIELVLLIGQYAQRYYLNDHHKQLTPRLKAFTESGDASGRFFPLPHPSPRNRIWLKQNPWFEVETLALLRDRVSKCLRA